jgi:hypothetical protein
MSSASISLSIDEGDHPSHASAPLQLGYRLQSMFLSVILWRAVQVVGVELPTWVSKGEGAGFSAWGFNITLLYENVFEE